MVSSTKVGSFFKGLSVWPWNDRIDADGFGVDGGGVVNGIL